MKVTESSHCMGHGELILRTFIYSQQCTHKMKSQGACCELSVSFATLTVSSLLRLHGESSDDLTNISQQAHGVSLKFFVFSQWLMTNTFKQTNRKLTAMPQRELSCELTLLQYYFILVLFLFYLKFLL